MKLSHISITLLLALSAVATATSCKDDKEEIIDPIQSQPVAEAIVGKWLLASSTADEWTVYEFKNFQMTSEWMSDGIVRSGSGRYFTNDEKASLTGTIADGNENYRYLDWRITGVSAFQLNLNLYGGDGNQLIGTDALYRIIGAQESERGTRFTPDYKVLAGTPDCSEFISLDETVVKVNAVSGEIECLAEGSTFIVFTTPAGKGVLTVSVKDKIMSLLENLQGTWVVDIVGNEWERDYFGPNGYFYSQWSRQIIYPTSGESAQGTYSVDEAKKIIYVNARTPYNQPLSAEYRITSIDRFSFNADIFSGGDQTGVYYYQKILESITLAPGKTAFPDYSALVGTVSIAGFNSHEEKTATVNQASGLITAVAKGITYIDVRTPLGVGVIEVNVE